MQIKACDDWLGRLTESKERLNGMPELHIAFDHYKIKVRNWAVTFDCYCRSEGARISVIVSACMWWQVAELQMDKAKAYKGGEIKPGDPRSS